jgi:hypothetical protein
MNIFFLESGDEKLPPEKMKILNLEAVPYSDHTRVGVRFVLPPFQQKPNIEIQINNPQNQIVANLNVVEVMDARMTFTMHMRQTEIIMGEYQVNMRLYYTDLSIFSEEGEDEESIPSDSFLEDNSQTVETKTVTFTLPKTD